MTPTEWKLYWALAEYSKRDALLEAQYDAVKKVFILPPHRGIHILPLHISETTGYVEIV